MKPRRTTKVLPSSTCSTPETSRPNVSWKALACSGVIVMVSSSVSGSMRGIDPVVCSRIDGAVRRHREREVRILVAEGAAPDHLALHLCCGIVVGTARDGDAVVTGGPAAVRGGSSAPQPVPLARGDPRIRSERLDRL